jgi:hypothetical protein
MSTIINPSRVTPLTIHEFKLFAPAVVDQAATVAYLDTGANHITVSPQSAIGKPDAGSKKIGSAFDQKVFQSVGDIEIEFLGYYHRVNAQVHQMEEGNLPFVSNITLDAPTIFAHPIIFDFRLMGIMLPAETSGEDWRELPARYMDGKDLCIVQMGSGRHVVQALFDTGAGVSVINSVHLAEIELDLKPAYTLEISDATGAKTMQELSSCSGLQLDNIGMPPFDCFPIDLQGIENAIDTRIDLVFGANAMIKSGFRWQFNKPENKVWVSE